MKRVSLTALAVLVLAASCSDETTVYSDPSEDVSVEKSESVLQNSILFDDAGVLEIAGEAALTGKTAKGADEEAGDYPLTLVARVDPPSYSDAENLTASHVHVDGDGDGVGVGDGEGDGGFLAQSRSAFYFFEEK